MNADDYEYGWIGKFTADGGFWDASKSGDTRERTELQIALMQEEEDRFEDGDTHVTYVLARRPKQQPWEPLEAVHDA